MASLDTDVRYIKGIGEKKAQALNKLGVFSLFDLISYFPRKYEDRSSCKLIALTMDGETVCICAMVAAPPRLVHIRRGLDIVRLRVVDESGSMEISYFNQSYMRDNLSVGETYFFYARVEISGNRRSMTNPVFEKESGDRSKTGRIMPIYRIRAGLNQTVLQQSIASGLKECGEILPDVLPPEVRERCSLVQAGYAYKNIHLPQDFESLELARRRLIFEELFVLSCALGKVHGERTKDKGISMPDTDLSGFWSLLDFSPTTAQRRAVEQALSDMSSGYVMNRLVQGDVGSGKTVVAAALMYCAYKNGWCSAFMVPTEILAEQHFNGLSVLLGKAGIRVGKLVGSMTPKEKRIVKEQLKNGELDVVVGTHALFSEDVEYSRLGLIVTDEQHRFGVNQRAALIGKGQTPHVLVMSATPIPRTLALIIYGDLDVSVIDELPPGRQKIDTFAVDESYRSRLNGFIRKQCTEGRQVYVVCPMVDENEDLPQKLKSAQEHAEELKRVFPDLTIGCVHGKMKGKDKEAVMSAFVSGEIDILVATTVIEVGVDVPNSSLMVIENAERFGLSQLHQLRGRVGRGRHKSWCILMSDAEGEEARSRLEIMCKTNDGFKISEEDLRLRGPGDFFGSRQHGLPEMHVADLGADAEVLQKAQQEALMLLAADPGLTKDENKELKKRVDKLLLAGADSFN